MNPNPTPVQLAQRLLSLSRYTASSAFPDGTPHLFVSVHGHLVPVTDACIHEHAGEVCVVIVCPPTPLEPPGRGERLSSPVDDAGPIDTDPRQ